MQQKFSSWLSPECCIHAALLLVLSPADVGEGAFAQFEDV